MKTGDAGIALIKEFESCELEAYPDPGTGAEPITIGWGHTGGVTIEDTCTQEQADAWLAADLERFERCVNSAVTLPITQTQFDALVSLAYNIGETAFRKSTLVRLLNQGDDLGAAQQFVRWNRSGGKTMAGLTRRREAESALFLS